MFVSVNVACDRSVSGSDYRLHYMMADMHVYLVCLVYQPDISFGKRRGYQKSMVKEGFRIFFILVLCEVSPEADKLFFHFK